jgi:hypothetical protein
MSGGGGRPVVVGYQDRERKPTRRGFKEESRPSSMVRTSENPVNAKFGPWLRLRQFEDLGVALGQHNAECEPGAVCRSGGAPSPCQT